MWWAGVGDALGSAFAFALALQSPFGHVRMFAEDRLTGGVYCEMNGVLALKRHAVDAKHHSNLVGDACEAATIKPHKLPYKVSKAKCRLALL